MKKRFIALAVAMIILLYSVGAYAVDTNDSNTWEYQAYGNGIKITKYNGTQTDVYVPSKIEVDGEFLSVIKLEDGLFKDNDKINSATLGEGITEIGASAFEGATNLVCIITPESLTTIGANAFSGCTAFNSVILYDNVEVIAENAFEGCSHLTVYCNENSDAHIFLENNNIKYVIRDPEIVTDIVTVDGVEYYIMNGEAFAISFDDSRTELTLPSDINGYPLTDIRTAFKGTSTLKSIVLPYGLKEIKDNAFTDSKALTNVKMYDNVTYIGKGAFSNCKALKDVTLSNSIEAIDDDAFYKCSFLGDVKLPKTLKSIGEEAFLGCICFDNLILPENLEEVEWGAFAECSLITSVTIPESLKYVGRFMFGDCKYLSTVYLHDKLEKIDSGAFNGCYRLEKITIPESVTTIGTSAFAGCSALTEIVIPDTVTTIGSNAFTNCSALTKVDLPANISEITSYTFKDCTSLTEITIPEGVEVLKSQSFDSCTKLSNVVLPDSLKKIEGAAFKGCTNLVSIKVPKGVTEIGTDAFPGETQLVVFEGSYAHIYAIQNQLPYIEYSDDGEAEIITVDNIDYMILNNQAIAVKALPTLTSAEIPSEVNGYPVTGIRTAFKNCSLLKSVKLPDTIESIGDSSFYGCKGLTSVEIPESVTYIGAYAFGTCSNLKTINIPKKVTAIGDYAFYACSNATEINIPDGVTVIGNRAFSRCLIVENINIPNSVVRIGDYAFCECFKLQSIIISDSVTELGGGAFENCTALSSVTLPKNLTSIKLRTFYACSKLSTLIIPEKVISIGNVAFSNSGLQSINIPSSVETIGNMAFYDCKSLRSVELSEGLKTIEDEAFYCNGNHKDMLGNITIPKSVTSIGRRAFSLITILNVYDNTYGINYATENEYPYVINDGNSDDKIFMVNGVRYYVTDGTAVVGHCDPTLTTVTIPESVIGYKVTGIGMAFKENTTIQKVVLPEGLLHIGKDAFYKCSSLVSVSMPDSVTYIEERAFYECTNMTDFQLPKNLTELGNYALYNCHKISEIIIPEGLKNISNSVFSGCTSITEITIPEGVKQLGDSSFSSCTKLSSISLPESLEYIGERAFRTCSMLTDIDIPENVNCIGAGAFMECYTLKSVAIPEGVTEISENTFMLCRELESISIPNTVEAIGKLAFENCHKLKTVEIPDSVKTIGEYAFYNCMGLISVKNSRNLETLGDKIFYNADGLKNLVVPPSVSEIYSESVPDNTIWIVTKDTYAYNFARENDRVYFVLPKNDNPEITFGTEITGTATYVDGSAAKNTTVEILYDNGELKESVKTNDKGEYLFTYAEVGRYTIRVTDTNGNTSNEVVSIKRMNVFDVYVAGETDLVLKKGCTVSGIVSPATAIVTLTDTDGNVISSVSTTDGTFAFANIPRGEYIIKAETANGSTTVLIYVSNEDINDISVEVTAQTSTIYGTTKIENRDGTLTSKIWIGVDLYNEDGVIVGHANTDENGAYTFSKVPTGNYKIVAKTNEIRSNATGGYDKNCELTGYAHIDIIENGEYTIETIILREEQINFTSIIGKIIANGEPQKESRVILTDEVGNQIAVYITPSSGDFVFTNIPDGMYCITAITKSNGAGFSVVVVENNIVYGNTQIKTEKSDKLGEREKTLLSIPECSTKEESLLYKEIILAEKDFYDSLSEKERDQLSEQWIDVLFKLVGLVSDSSLSVTEGVTVVDEESLISADEVDNSIRFVLSVLEVDEVSVGEDGITTEEEYESEKIKDEKGKNKEIAKYYDITFSKNGKNISNIQKHTETNGKLRITMEIPEEYRGHKHYSFIHMHKGEAETLVDLDDNPNTVTFEIDKFSTFALAYSDVELTGEVEQPTYPASISYNSETGKISVTSIEDGTLYIATYEGKRLSTVETHAVTAGTVNEEYEFGLNQAAFVWDENIAPLCEKFTLGN